MRLCAALIVLAACGDNTVTEDKLAACSFAATVQDRKAIGPAAPYVPDVLDEAQLAASMTARRQAAWNVVGKVVAPVPLADLPGTVPAWQTWYARDDFQRVFEHLYRALTPDERRARAPIDAKAGLAWNATALDGLADWPEQRYLDYLAQFQTRDQIQGIGGVDRVGYSPGAMTHLIASYARQDACRIGTDPPAYADDAVRAGAPVVETEDVTVDPCGWRLLGPYMAGAAPVTVTADAGELFVRRGAPPSFDDRCGASCTVAGDGAIYVAVAAAEPTEVHVEVDYLAQDVADPACLDGAMPRDAVLVKADWQRVLGDPLDTFDTSPDRMRERLGGDATWTPDGTADPGDADIFTVQLPTGQVFRLPALHIMTKELDHWLWITLWWSPSPDGDFGADRPPLPGVWRNYKMCVVADYLDHGQPSWCSNPYLEQGTGNAGTNCIGCHQHGGTALLPEDILAAPHHGTPRVRNNFFTDYLWAIKGGRGEELSAIVQAELDYWDAADGK